MISAMEPYPITAIAIPIINRSSIIQLLQEFQSD
jgi:hypothetical protein